MKVMLIGAPGSGKSTLARTLQAKTGWPLLALDQIWHALPAGPAAKATFNAAQRHFMAAHASWLIDGNYASSIPLRLAQADLVVWLRVSPPLALLRIVRRSVRFRIDPSSRPDMAPGFKEQLDADYLAFLWYGLTFRRTQEPRLKAMLLATPPAALWIIDSPAGKSALIGALTQAARGGR